MERQTFKEISTEECGQICIYIFYSQTRSFTLECDGIKADHEEQLPERFIILWNSLRSDLYLMTKIIWNNAGSKETMRTSLEVPQILQRYQQQPPLPGTTDFPDVLVVSHVPAILNEESALSGSPEGLHLLTNTPHLLFHLLFLELYTKLVVSITHP